MSGTADRVAKGYEPRWDLPDQIGRQGELFVCEAIDAIKSYASAEIKTDSVTARTGNVFLESEAKVSGQWVKSGINREAVIWCHVVLDTIVVFAPREHVRHIAMTYGTPVSQNGRHPTRGYLVKLPEFMTQLARYTWEQNRGG